MHASSALCTRGQVAVVGIGCRLPRNIYSPEELVEFLQSRGDAVVDVPRDRWSRDLYCHPDPKMPGKAYASRAAFLEQRILDFDPEPFGISPREADSLDPQQRLLLEVTWEAFEDAGLALTTVQGSNTAVFVGGFNLDSLSLAYSPENLELINSHTSTAASMTILSNRLSYTFDLRGPSATVDTACSSSLVALHLGCNAIVHGGSDMALVGGVNVMLSPAPMIAMCKGQFLAHDGHSKAFDAKADGYGRGEGAVMVVLKRLECALRDRDRIYAVIRATGVNQDGRTDGIALPNEQAQKQLGEAVLKASGLRADEIGYVEAHGTGTRAGDPIEARALGAVYGRERAHPLMIGSVKTNIGHLEAAAGVAGFVKATMCVYHRIILPQRGPENPNPEIPFDNLGLRIATQATTWPSDGPANAAVNSFGYGGTNAHAIVSEWRGAPSGADLHPRSNLTTARSTPWLIPISAASRRSLEAFSARLAEEVSEAAWLDQAYTLARHRSHLTERAVVLAQSASELADELRKVARSESSDKHVIGRAATDRRLLWVFTGMGPQWWAMGRELYEHEPLFREAAIEADQAFVNAAGWSILAEMLRDEASSRMNANEIAQPANYLLQVCLVRLLRELGVPAHGMLGHSVGEVVVAWASGCLSLQDAAVVVCHRSRVQQKAAGKGTMLVVAASADQVQPWLLDAGDVAIAAYNGPNSITLAGGRPALERLARKLEAASIFHKKVSVDVAYHSPHLSQYEGELLNSLRNVRPSSPECPIYSTVFGARVQEAVHDAQYWWDNARQPVLFQHALEAAIEDGYTSFLEIGPHPVLAASIREVLAHKEREGRMFHCLKRNQAERLTLLRAVAEMHVWGVPLDWSRMFPTGGRARVPHYSFQRERHWLESKAARDSRLGRQEACSLLSRRDSGPTPRFITDMARPSVRYLQDHRVQGMVVVPAAAFVEAGLCASVEVQGQGGQHALEDIKFDRAFVLRPGGTPELLVDVSLESWTIQFFGRHGEDGWEPHARGRVVERPSYDPVQPLRLERLLAEVDERLDVDGVYHHLRNTGLDYGPEFRGLREIWVSREQRGGGGPSVLARIGTQQDLDSRTCIHPTLLDAGFQALLCLLPSGADAMVPIAIERVWWAGNGQTPAWAFGQLKRATGRGLLADLVLAAEDGTVLCKVQGLVCQALERPASTRAPRQASWVHVDGWQEQPWPNLPDPQSGSWRLVGNAGPFLLGLAEALTGLGIDVRVLENVEPKGFQACSKVVLVATADCADPAGISGCKELSAIVNTIRDVPCSLHVITIGGQIAIASDRVHPALTALWGFARVVMTEFPDLRCRLMDLQETKLPSYLEVAKMLSFEEMEEECAVRERTLFVRRLRRVDAEREKPSTVVVASEYEGSYGLALLEPGRPENVGFVSRTRVSPGPTEVEVAVTAAALDECDFETARRHRQALFEEEEQAAFGASVAGTVVTIGNQVTQVQPGDIVQVFQSGAVASHITAAVSRVVKIMVGHSDAQAVQYVTFFRAWHAINEIARIQPGESVLVFGTTALGLACAQVAQHRGARVVATSEGGDVADLLRSYGVSHVLSSRALDLAEQIRGIVPDGGLDVVIDTRTGSNRTLVVGLLRRGGRLVEMGNFSRYESESLDSRVLRESISLLCVDLDRWATDRPNEYTALVRAVMAAFAAGRLQFLPIDWVPAATVVSLLTTGRGRTGAAIPVLDMRSRDFYVETRGVRPMLFAAHGTFLITGGLTGFGLAAAEWLAEQGARSIVLASRRGWPDGNAQETIRRMQGQGVRVECTELDVTIPESVDRVLSWMNDKLPPLIGIIHSAMVLEDRSIEALDEESIRRVLLPKAYGAWLLHEKTRSYTLEHFILFSSVSALIGNPNQAAYAAANSYLDGLASLRESEGLPTMTVSWGAIRDTGVVAQNAATEAHLRGLGIRPMAVAEALGALARAMSTHPKRLGIIDVDWDKWMNCLPRTPWSRLAELASGERSAEDDALSKLRRALAQLDRAAKKRAVLDRVLQAVVTVLRLQPDRLDTASSLRGHGLDSLLALELQLALERAVGISVSTIELLAGVTIDELAQRVVDKLERPSGAVSRPPSVVPANRDTTADFLSRICVQPPYFDLHDVTRKGDWLEATALPLAPTQCEDDAVSCAEAARHLAILGSCAASLSCPWPGKVYYPVLRARYPESMAERVVPESAQEPLDRVRLRARCTSFDMKASRARAETELLDWEGNLVIALMVEYHVIPVSQFRRLFRDRFERTHEDSAANPYLSWRPLPAAMQKEAVVSVNLGKVDPLACLGHFVGYPVLPLSIMTRDAVRLVAEGARRRRGWDDVRVAVLGGGVDTTSFVFAHESVNMTARFERESDGEPIETWRCEVRSGSSLAATFEFVLRVRRSDPIR